MITMNEQETNNLAPLDLRITKQELLAMKKVHWVEEPAAIVLYGMDATEEWVKFYFREDDNYPDEIEVSSVNNVVSLMDPESLTWDRLAFAIWLCFSPYTDYNIIDLVLALPVHVKIEAVRE